MTTGTWGEHASNGIVRAVFAAFFAMALVLAVTAPAAADMHDAPEGFYAGTVTDADEDEQWIEADGVVISQEQFEEWFESEEEELPEGEDFEGLIFELFEDDDYYVNFEESDKEHFLCVAALNLDDALFAADYDPDEHSLFGIWVEDDECPDEQPAPPEPQEHDEEDPPAVTPAERVETGAGGTAGGGAGVLALLFGLIAAAGATVLRRGSATS
jgi:hypothetical protein